MNDRFRILSLSGGGVRGIVQAAFLSKLASGLKKPLRESFDLIAGTSTGSITALAITLGIDLARVVDLFRLRAKAIFDPRWLSGVRQGPRYDGAVLRRELESVFGTTQLRDAKPNVLVTASWLDQFAHRVFSSLPDADSDKTLSVVEVVLASCAAPTYFAPVKPAGQERTYLDGGLWANSPSLLAVLTANRQLSIPFSSMRVLSLGTGTWPAGKTAEHLANMRPFSPESVRIVLELLFAAQVSSADWLAKEMVGPDAILSIAPALKDELLLDDVPRALRELPPLAEALAQENLVAIRRLLGDESDAEDVKQESSASQPSWVSREASSRRRA